jgi:hypothetical protein
VAWGKISLARGIHCCPNLFLFILPDQRLCNVKNVWVHIPDYVETVYELPFVPNSTASEIFLHESEAVRSIDWIIISDWAKT